MQKLYDTELSTKIMQENLFCENLRINSHFGHKNCHIRHKSLVSINQNLHLGSFRIGLLPSPAPKSYLVSKSRLEEQTTTLG